jgi:hypothetical protein
MPMPANAAPSFTSLIESCRDRDIDPSLPVRRAHQAPLNDQLAGQAVTPEAWAKLTTPCDGNRDIANHTIIDRGYDIYAAHIKSTTIGRLALRLP